MRQTTSTRGPGTWVRRAAAAIGVAAIGTTTLVAGAVPALAEPEVISYSIAGDTLTLTCAADLGGSPNPLWVLDYADWDITNGWDGTSVKARSAGVAPNYPIDISPLAGGTYNIFARCIYKPTWQGNTGGTTPYIVSDQFEYLKAPSAVRGLSATPRVGAIDLTWSPPDHDSGLGVTYLITSDRGLSTSTTDLSFTDTTVPVGTTVTYTVTPQNSAGTGTGTPATATAIGSTPILDLAPTDEIKVGVSPSFDAWVSLENTYAEGSVRLLVGGTPVSTWQPLVAGYARLDAAAPTQGGPITYTLQFLDPDNREFTLDRSYHVASAPPVDGGDGDGDPTPNPNPNPNPNPTNPTPTPDPAPVTPDVSVPGTVTTTVGTPVQVRVALPSAKGPRPTTLVVTSGGRTLTTVTVPATGDLVVDLGVLPPGTHALTFATPASAGLRAWSAPVSVSVTGEPPATAGAPTARLAGSTSSAAPGTEIELVARDFQPGETVVFFLHSEPVLLGTAVADADGVARLTVALPTDVPAGDHHVRATGGTSGRSAEIALAIGTATPVANPVAAPAATELATTGSSTAALVAAQALLLGGGALLLVARRRLAAGR